MVKHFCDRCGAELPPRSADYTQELTYRKGNFLIRVRAFQIAVEGKEAPRQGERHADICKTCIALIAEDREGEAVTPVGNRQRGT